MKSARGTAGTGEGRATFRVQVFRPSDKAPSDSHLGEKEKHAAMRVATAAGAACSASFHGIDDLLGFSSHSSGGSGLSSASTGGMGGSSGGLSATSGGSLLGDRATPAHCPLNESWSTADELHRTADSAKSVERKNDTAAPSPQGLSIPAAEQAGKTGSADAAAAGIPHGPADHAKEEKLPTFFDTPGTPTPVGQDGAVAGGGKASSGGLANAQETSPGIPSPSSTRRDQDAAQLSTQDGSGADSGYSDDGFDDEDDNNGSDRAARTSATSSLFFFSSASSKHSFESDFDEDCSGGDDDDGNASRDEAGRARQHKRDEMAVSSAAAQLRRRLLRAAAKCGSGGDENARAGAALLFDRLDQVRKETKSFISRLSGKQRFPTRAKRTIGLNVKLNHNVCFA